MGVLAIAQRVLLQPWKDVQRFLKIKLTASTFCLHFFFCRASVMRSWNVAHVPDRCILALLKVGRQSDLPILRVKHSTVLALISRFIHFTTTGSRPLWSFFTRGCYGRLLLFLGVFSDGDHSVSVHPLLTLVLVSGCLCLGVMCGCMCVWWRALHIAVCIEQSNLSLSHHFMLLCASAHLSHAILSAATKEYFIGDELFQS